MQKQFLQKIISLLVVTLCLVATIQAQTKIGPPAGAPNANAMLEVSSTNKGLLLPRLALVQTTNPAPLTAHVAGMFVYNTATANDVTPGIYYNDGTQWAQGKFATCQGFGANFFPSNQSIPANSLTKILFTVASEEWDQGNVFNPTTGEFTVTEAGKYLITGTCANNTPTANSNGDLRIYKNGAYLLSGSLLNTSTGYGLVVTYVANLAVGDKIDLRTSINSGGSTTVFGASFSAVKVDCGAAGTGGGLTSVTASAPLTGDGTVGNPLAILNNSFWETDGNTGTSAATNFIGTTDAVDFVTRTNSLERMRVTSGGNVGIGTAAPNAPLQFANTVANRKIVLFEIGNNDHQFYDLGIGSNVLRYQVDNPVANHAFYAGTSTTTSNELMRITGTGNVGIGTAAPIGKLHTVSTGVLNYMDVYGGTPMQLLLRQANGTAAAPTATTNSNQLGAILFQGHNGTSFSPSAYSGMYSYATENQTPTAGGNDLRFNTTPNGTTTSALRMTIANNGSVGIGLSNVVSGVPAIATVCNVNNNYGAIFQNLNNGNNSAGLHILAGSNVSGNVGTAMIQFVRGGDGASIGNITQNSLTSVSYNTSSDRRLKENIRTSVHGLSTILKLQVRDYNYIGDKTLATGLIAQDAYQVVPSVVHVGSEDVKKNPWSIDYGKLTPYLIQAVQEQQTQIEALKAQNATKDAQIAALQAQATASVSRTEYNELKAMVAQLLAQKNTSVTTATDEKK